MPSASTVFVDTNVLLYAQDPRDPTKQGRAAAWLEVCWRNDLGRLSTQVLHELYVNLQRVAPRYGVTAARALTTRYRAWRPWLVDESTIDAAWEIQDRFAVSYWDALMVGAAKMQGCRYLLTEDLQHDQRFDRVRVVNPFLVGPELLDAAP